ncbi:hypothetical protein FQA47_017395 [Oryzias melastigma]|uniref:Uncharacterized protein n=1 Tax=Oryzias melastigma TaxID=30732 RepID=A0A834BST0_ORYME|nr:hypothetical protein FQA47_017395 [Oryzias melastigma]
MFNCDMFRVHLNNPLIAKGCVNLDDDDDRGGWRSSLPRSHPSPSPPVKPETWRRLPQLTPSPPAACHRRHGEIPTGRGGILTRIR